MLFRDSYITDAGAELLARATASEGAIVWTRAATTSKNTDGYNDIEMNALDDDDFETLTSSGAVTNAIVTDARDSVSIYCELTNETYSGTACTFGAWAKIQGDENDVLVIVARCGGATPTVINPASQGVVKAFVDFTLQISAEQAQAIKAAEGYYATAAALQSEQTAREALAGRVVSTHSAVDENAGDAQSIRGEKSFRDNSYFKSVQPLHLCSIVIYQYDQSIDEATYIESLSSILEIDSTEAEKLYEAITNTYFTQSSYSIDVPSYNILESNIDTIVSDLNRAGLSCSKNTTTSDIGGYESPFDYAYLSKGMTIRNDKQYAYKQITMGTASVRADGCLRAKQNGNSENYIEMRIATYGGDFGPSIRANVAFEGDTPVSSVELRATKYMGSGDSGPTLRLRNQIIDSSNVSSINGSARSFSMAAEYNGTPYFTANADGVTAPKFFAMDITASEDASIGGDLTVDGEVILERVTGSYRYIDTITSEAIELVNEGIASTTIQAGLIKVNNANLPSINDIAGYQPATEPGGQPTFNDVIGSIRLFGIYAPGSGQTTSTVYPGNVINNTYSYYLKHNGTSWIRTSEHPTGTWRALNTCDSIYGSLEGMVLAIKTAE